MKKVLLGIFILIDVLIAFVIFAILVPGGTFKNIKPHFAGTSKNIPLAIPGPEDIEIDRMEGIVFVSVSDRRKKTDGAGGILMYTIEEGIEGIRNITPGNLIDFHPHGISLYRSNENQLFLFVINHKGSDEEVVERFEWKNDSLIHLESIADKNMMTSPNDIVAMDEKRFYVTNDHYYTAGVSQTLEEYLQRPLSFVNYYDGKSFRTVARDIGYANGINQTPDGKYIVVAATSGRALHVYEIEEDANLKEVDKIDLGTGPDNIDFDRDGNILIACHPKLLKYVAHAENAKNYSPSQVLKIKFNKPKDFVIEEVFLNDGTGYSGSSVAVIYGNTMLIGSVFEPSLLLCTFE